MKIKNKYFGRRGFTIIELFAIIGILSILAVLVVPNVLKLYRQARIEAFKTNVKSISKSIDNYIFEHGEIPPEGIDISTLDVTNKKIFTGKYIKNENSRIEADNVSDGFYCAEGEMESLRVEVGCENLDTTEPENLAITIFEKTTNSVSIVGSAVDNESGIKKYEFKIDEENYIDNNENNTYIFTKLITNNHTIYMRVTNGKGLTSITSIEVSLDSITPPTYLVNPSGWAKSKTITIIYTEKNDNYEYSYSIDEGSNWIIVDNGANTDVIFNENDVIIGKVSDGINSVTSSQTISQIDNINPNISAITIDATNLSSNGFTITKTGYATDAESGLANNPYIYEISTDGIPFIIKCTNNVDACIISDLTPITTYYYRVCAIDVVGNQSCTESKTITTPSSVVTFENTGDDQTYIVPVSGTYKIEAYGAQGDGPVIVGSIFPKIDEETLVAVSGGAGGKGGYVSGNIYLTAGSVLTVNVGGQNGYNGGGIGVYNGGGATSIASESTTLIIAAGGGGGSTGTPGGNGTGSGGVGSIGAGYNAAAPSSYTSVNGAAGTNGGGGGSGNIFKDCTGYNQVYNSCKTTQNTCSYGCDSVYDPCATITNPRTTSCSICGYYCGSGWTKSGSSCYIHYSTSGMCLANCAYSCDVTDCVRSAECATCYPDTCNAGWVDSNCSSCYYGSPNACVAGYDQGTCNAFTEEKYNSGQGGSNVLHASLTNTISSSDIQSGNGRAILTYIGE